MNSPNLTIGALSAQTGCNVATIRYYEQIGLLPRPQRAGNGHRYYRDADLRRLTFIRRCRDIGFPIERVRILVSLFEDGGRACAEARDLVQEHLETVRAKLDELRQLEASLAAFVNDCDASCNGGATRDCVIIGDLSASCCAAPNEAAPRRMAATDLKRTC